MSKTEHLLIEIGTEELPPKSLKKLACAFKDEITRGLTDAELKFKQANWYATPRRLAVVLNDLEVSQKDKSQQRRGPSISVAYDEVGNPTSATKGFAKSCGVGVSDLDRLKTSKGEWLAATNVITGKKTPALLADIIETALHRLPIAKRMRWGDQEVEFVRPIKWIFVLFGRETVNCNIMRLQSTSKSVGHRFHHPDPVSIETPCAYVEALKKAYVLVDYNERRTMIETEVKAIAKKNTGEAIIDPSLLDEVTALVEWPVSFSGSFDPAFLSLPKEVLISSMQDHQKYFPVIDAKGKLLPSFISVANIESHQPELIKQGNERVIQPRLSDADFFWQRDLKQGLSAHISGLNKIIYQKELGTLADKSQRLINTTANLAALLNANSEHTKRAAELCLCDLLSNMVSEFPNLQGTMGRYYAEADTEDSAVAIALEEYYMPRFAGDRLPSTTVGQCLAMSEKIDTLVGIFSIGKAPTGDKDPFALRRSAIGLLRIIIECRLDIDLKQLIELAATNFPDKINAYNHADEVYQFLLERMRRYYLDENISVDTFESVLAIKTPKPFDFHQRVIAVTTFRKLPQAASLAAANKRISNILKKSNFAELTSIEPSLLIETAEITLANSVKEYEEKIPPLAEKGDYQETLTQLANLRDQIDVFFDNVMVNCDDTATRNNRLALLSSINKLFLKVADISKLQN